VLTATNVQNYAAKDISKACRHGWWTPCLILFSTEQLVFKQLMAIKDDVDLIKLHKLQTGPLRCSKQCHLVAWFNNFTCSSQLPIFFPTWKKSLNSLSYSALK